MSQTQVLGFWLDNAKVLTQLREERPAATLHQVYELLYRRYHDCDHKQPLSAAAVREISLDVEDRDDLPDYVAFQFVSRILGIANLQEIYPLWNNPYEMERVKVKLVPFLSTSVHGHCLCAAE